ncbi:hypothetical protein [Frankia sp. AgB32]|uniref:hypothetical protein n=1 Tax=Frankia sp. AgB32 TaxID=631119 RepID=UPI00200EB5D5|nr:hypothetical protein [Frankia sp. AgB32]MCK9896881.1 hypothetical protein [Frankia sp. AgB32]
MSAERLAPYEQACDGDVVRAIALYGWNSAVSAAFYEILGLFEVALRNALHDQLTAWHARQRRSGEWWDAPTGTLETRARQDIADARSRIRRNNKIAIPGRVVAELNFGFWRYLLSRRYEATLWTPALRHAFPRLRPARRATVYEPVNRLVNLRNRIAHHEPIHNRPLKQTHADLLRVADYLDADVHDWIMSHSRVPGLLSTKPASDVPAPRQSPDQYLGHK